MKKIFFWGFAISVLLTISCEKNHSIQQEEVKNVLNGKTRVFDSESALSIVEVGDEFIVMEDSSDVGSTIAPGDVIAVPATEKTPFGLLRKVVQIEGNRFFTEDATLEDAFEELNYSFSEAIVNKGNQQYKSGKSGEEDSVKIEVSAKIEGNLAVEFSSAFVTYIDTCNIEIKSGQLEEFVFSTRAEMEVGIGISASASASLNMEREVYRKKLKTKTKWIPTALGIPFPLVYTPTFSARVGVEGEVRGEINFQGSASQKVEGKVAYKNSEWNTSAREEPMLMETSMQGDIQVEIQPSVTGTMEIEFYKKEYAGGDVIFEVNPYLKFSATPLHQDTTCEVEPGIKGSVTADLYWLSKRKGRFEAKDFFNFSKVAYVCEKESVLDNYWYTFRITPIADSTIHFVNCNEPEAIDITFFLNKTDGNEEEGYAANSGGVYSNMPALLGNKKINNSSITNGIHTNAHFSSNAGMERIIFGGLFMYWEICGRNGIQGNMEEVAINVEESELPEWELGIPDYGTKYEISGNISYTIREELANSKCDTNGTRSFCVEGNKLIPVQNINFFNKMQLEMLYVGKEPPVGVSVGMLYAKEYRPG